MPTVASIALAVLLTLTVGATAAPVCTVGSGSGAWSGNPADLAAIEARYQMEQAQQDGQAHPSGASVPSPWTGLVRCSVGS
jgi:hypothetical protein